MEKKEKRPNEKDLELLAYGLTWRVHAMLPTNQKDRDTLITDIIELWEKIRGK